MTLVCGCSPRGPCPVAAPLFKYGRMRKLLVHLRYAHERTLLAPRRAERRAKQKDGGSVQ